ncbi:hypothetical protein [Corynebacterium sp.]|uniref:hypothetical protein n=1 Tax=Corynebacterium sp. TaxID=1720 RepID=UPI00290C16AE|nr:hypothetical protein [Corynebacterium sp.]MDU4634201.1 hypothetical protein [Corynebacterium sp.]
MNANDIAPNLYEEWGLDRRDGERELLVLLESKDLSLEQQDDGTTDKRREFIHTTRKQRAAETTADE